jgi:hypothetical protein
MIPGTFTDDLIAHSFCSCCAICQEAREAKSVNLGNIDYCFGEPLIEREIAHDAAIEQGGSCFNSLKYQFQSLSKTSKFILFLWVGVAIFTVFSDLILNRSSNIFILFLIFAQPITILYFVYWKSRRQYAILDYVVKTFAYGFW